VPAHKILNTNPILFNLQYLFTIYYKEDRKITSRFRTLGVANVRYLKVFPRLYLTDLTPRVLIIENRAGEVK